MMAIILFYSAQSVVKAACKFCPNDMNLPRHIIATWEMPVNRLRKLLMSFFFLL